MLHIVTDSTSDISKEYQEKLNINVVPLTVNFGDEQYLDNIDLSNQEFYEKLSKVTSLPTTSQVNPNEFIDCFKELLKNEDDEIIGIFISSELSGTFQSATIAKDALDNDRIHLIDSKTATFALGLLVFELAKLRDEGLPTNEIIDKIENLKEKVCIYALVDTLKYLKMGGRLSKTAALIGELLNIIPILSLVNGKVDAIAKVKGKKASYNYLLNQLNKDDVDKNYPVFVGHANSKENANNLIEHLKPAIDLENSILLDIGCTIGTHTGPGALGIAYIKK